MIPLFAVNMPPAAELMPELEQVLYSGYIGQGPKVEQFERQLGDLLDNPRVLTVNSGTSALQLALRLANVKGGEVITTPMTCTATNFPILAEGAEIRWADVDPATGLIDPEDVERQITPRTRAIMCVHWGGSPCYLDALNMIGMRFGIPVIEDAAHALGSEYRGRPIGTVSDFTCFSFQAIKHLTTVDGGLLACTFQGDYERGKLLRWYGIDREGSRKDMRCEEDVREWGYKFHMNDVAATIGLVQLRHLDEIVAAHRENAACYDRRLNPYFERTARPGSAYWLYTVLLPSAEERDEFREYMAGRGVAVSQVHARNDTHSALTGSRRRLPGVDEFSSRQVSIPVHSQLTEAQLDQVVGAANDFSLLKAGGMWAA